MVADLAFRPSLGEPRRHLTRPSGAAALNASVALCALVLGDGTGLLEELALHGAATCAELGRLAGVRAKWARERLVHLTRSGYVDYDPATDRFELLAAREED